MFPDRPLYFPLFDQLHTDGVENSTPPSETFRPHSNNPALASGLLDYPRVWFMRTRNASWTSTNVGSSRPFGPFSFPRGRGREMQDISGLGIAIYNARFWVQASME